MASSIVTLDQLYALAGIASSSSMAPMAEDTHETLAAAALIERDPIGNWRISNRGQVLLSHVLALPMPEQVTEWRMPGESLPARRVSAWDGLTAWSLAEVQAASPPSKPPRVGPKSPYPVPDDLEGKKQLAARLMNESYGMQEIAEMLDMPASQVEEIFFGGAPT